MRIALKQDTRSPQLSCSLLALQGVARSITSAQRGMVPAGV
jgi:hypothetical protein